MLSFNPEHSIYIVKATYFFPPGRAEMLCKVEEVRREMESRLDSQRRHMVQKESQLKNEVEELKVNSQSYIEKLCVQSQVFLLVRHCVSFRAGSVISCDV